MLSNIVVVIFFSLLLMKYIQSSMVPLSGSAKSLLFLRVSVPSSIVLLFESVETFLAGTLRVQQP